MKKTITLLKLTSALLLGILLPGCGGGGSASQSVSSTGRFAVTIKWPARSRVIPSASNSIKLTLTGANGLLRTALLPRPVTGTENSTVFTGVSAGAVTLTASAFPIADGTGVVQAAGTAIGTVVNGQTTTITVSMDSTIVRLVVTPNDFFLASGNTQQMTVTAFDLNNSIVLIDPAKIQWKVSNIFNFSITATGICKSMFDGTGDTSSDITATEMESGKSIKGIASVFTNINS